MATTWRIFTRESAGLEPATFPNRCCTFQKHHGAFLLRNPTQQRKYAYAWRYLDIGHADGQFARFRHHLPGKKEPKNEPLEQEPYEEQAIEAFPEVIARIKRYQEESLPEPASRSSSDASPATTTATHEHPAPETEEHLSRDKSPIVEIIVKMASSGDVVPPAGSQYKKWT